MGGWKTTFYHLFSAALIQPTRMVFITSTRKLQPTVGPKTTKSKLNLFSVRNIIKVNVYKTTPGHRGLERGQSAGIESTGAGARRLERGTGRGTVRLRTGWLGLGNRWRWWVGWLGSCVFFFERWVMGVVFGTVYIVIVGSCFVFVC